MHREYAILEDISEGGLSLRFDPSIEPGSEIAVLYSKGKFEGRVKYCQLDNDSYLLGIEFLPGDRWSRRRYDPPHLVQFRLKIAEPTR